MESESIINIVLAVILGSYLLISVIYCMKRNQKIFVYWTDYIILISFLLLSCFMEIIEIISQSKGNNENSTNTNYIAMAIKCIDLCALSGLFIMNVLKGMFYIIGVYKLMNMPINFKDNADLSINYFGKQGITKYLTKIHYIFVVIVLVIQVLIAIIFVVKFDSNYYLSLSLNIIFLCLSLLIIFIVKQCYIKLINFQYFSNNLLIEKQFIKTKEQALCIIEHLINKNIFDIFINIPLIINNYLGIISEKTGSQVNFQSYYIIFYFIYIIFYGSLLLTIDNQNKVEIPRITNYFFFFYLFSYNIISLKRDVPLYNEHLYKSFVEDDIKAFRHSSFGIDTLNQEIVNEYYKTEKEYLPCNFFIIFKLLYLYFKKNKKVYLETERSVEDNGIPFRNFSSKDSKPLITSSNITDQISRISRISITNKERIVSSFKFTMDIIMNSMEERPLKEEFIKNILKDSNGNRLSDPYFKIEALFVDNLFELFPFYQISINDVMRSFDIGENKELFRYFFEVKSQKKQFNSFYTKDLFLSFEIYDHQFLPFNTIKKFMIEYKKYLFDKMKSCSYSFLPLIIGIFNVTYLSYCKIVVLYKNPIAFSACIKYNCWINYSYSNPNTTIRKSAKESEMADLEEIEVKNNIYLAENEYNETIKTLKSDLKFLKSHQYDQNFFLNLFVLNDSKKITNDLDIILFNTNNNNSVNKGQNDELIDAIKDTSNIRDSIDSFAKQLRKYYGSDVVALIEKLYENTVVKNKYVFKIYFSELFRNQSTLLNTELFTEMINKKNKQYCKV